MLKKHTKAYVFFLLAALLTLLPAFSASAKTKDIVITKTNFVLDTFNGVDALYRPGSGDGSNATYSCAAYVKKYYKSVYGVTVNNLFGSGTPNVEGSDYVVKVKKAQPGDIVCERTDHGTYHWSIVKEVYSDGSFLVIEQNYKWTSGGTTYARTGRVLDPDDVRLYRLHSEIVAAKEQNDEVETDEEAQTEDTKAAAETDDALEPETVSDVITALSTQ